MRKLLAVLTLTLPLLLLGCEQQGPMEEAGESIDETMEETGEAFEGDREG